MKRSVPVFLLLLLASTPSLFAWIVYPQVALGGGYECIILISNKLAVPWSGEIQLFQGNDESWLSTWSANGQNHSGSQTHAFTVPGNGTIKLRLTGDSQTRSGYLLIFAGTNSSTTDISVSYFYQYFDVSKQLITSTGTSAPTSHKVFCLPVEHTANANTGIAWCPDFETYQFQIVGSLYSESGSLVQQKSFYYTGHIARFIDELFSVPDDFRGFLKLESTEYMYLEALRMDTTQTGFLLTSTPPGS